MKIELCTFPEDDRNYCHCFTVPVRWLYRKLQAMDALNERKGVSIKNFIENYVWDETFAIYKMAQVAGVISNEYEQE